jgi:hypothetical protein
MGDYGMPGDRGIPVRNDMKRSRPLFYLSLHSREMLANKVLMGQEEELDEK